MKGNLKMWLVCNNQKIATILRSGANRRNSIYHALLCVCVCVYVGLFVIFYVCSCVCVSVLGIGVYLWCLFLFVGFCKSLKTTCHINAR